MKMHSQWCKSKIDRKLMFTVLLIISVFVTTWNQVKMLEPYLLLTVQRNILSNTASYQTSIISPSTSSRTKPRIAIISTFLVGEQSKKTKIEDLDHLINKACYAKLWGYDFILNMTYGFDKEVDEELGGAYWLNYGAWHRVPHIRDRINDYDWILYADTDYVINDMETPLESFFKNWELHGLNPSVIVPKDFYDKCYTFSSFVVLIKNDAFGRKVIDHWMDFGHGVCPNGNFAAKNRGYTWEDSDQPGVWYALTQTHKDFFPNSNISTGTSVCNETTGLIDTRRAFGPEMNHYFSSVNAIIGSDGSDLPKVPKEQPIIWSRGQFGSKNGIGLQLKWGKKSSLMDESDWDVFAFHHDNVDKWSSKSKVSLDLCKQVHGCYARYTVNDTLELGCDGIEYTVATPL